jgi:hypothetical protein
MHDDESCWLCGDGVDRESGDWDHCEDLGINVDGSIGTTDCNWGKPFAPTVLREID